MKPSIKFSLGVVLLSLAGALAVHAQSVTTNFADPSRTGLLRVDLIYGRIHVIGSDTRNVVIETRSPSGTADSAPGSLRELAKQPQVTLDRDSNRIKVTTDNPGIPADLEIHVPNQTNLQLSTVNQGDIQVDNVSGEFEIGSVNGSISLSKVSGSVLAHTVNGQVKATLLKVTPDKPMAFTSLNGAIDVTLPSDTKATLRLRSDNGTVSTDLPLTATDPASRRKNEFEVNKIVSGRLNGGGAQIEVRTFNGDVNVRKGP